jgi:hypothetical protein
MTSLPPKAPEKYKDHPRFPDIVSAYNHCLMAERALQGVDKGVSDLGKKLIYIRILGYLIHHLPRVEGVLNLKQEIVSAHQVGGTALFDIGKWYLDHYIRACTFPNLPSHRLWI